MEVKVTTEEVQFKPVKLMLELTIENALDFSTLVDEAVRFKGMDNEVISDSEGMPYHSLIEVSKSIFNTLKLSSSKEGQKES